MLLSTPKDASSSLTRPASAYGERLVSSSGNAASMVSSRVMLLVSDMMIPIYSVVSKRSLLCYVFLYIIKYTIRILINQHPYCRSFLEDLDEARSTNDLFWFRGVLILNILGSTDVAFWKEPMGLEEVEHWSLLIYRGGGGG